MLELPQTLILIIVGVIVLLYLIGLLMPVDTY